MRLFRTRAAAAACAALLLAACDNDPLLPGEGVLAFRYSGAREGRYVIRGTPTGGRSEYATAHVGANGTTTIQAFSSTEGVRGDFVVLVVRGLTTPGEVSACGNVQVEPCFAGHVTFDADPSVEQPTANTVLVANTFLFTSGEVTFTRSPASGRVEGRFSGRARNATGAEITIRDGAFAVVVPELLPA
ncbi:MAG TPA: hypothetical protein VFX98_11015 [Longimicrobiaceae bacterium]|nr:hypothetical protein [Longimicrobiaceae bacterium]